MTRVFFVRHAQPVHSHADDRSRPLTQEGVEDTKLVLDSLKGMHIDEFYCSPYKRSLDTIASTAEYFGMQIKTDERLRERENGTSGNDGAGISAFEMFKKRWENHDWHEDGGESISMVQNRNIEALKEIIAENDDKSIVIGTHGTALSSIMNYYYPNFGVDDFLRIIDWMPYIVEMDFDNGTAVSKKEIAYIKKEFKGQ